MLTNLYIKNMALIDELDIDFDGGLTILTGETGSGKSIILNSMAIALGLKTPGDILRNEEEAGIIQLSFYFKDKIMIEKLNKLGVENIENGDVIIQRKIVDKRSRFKINGISVTAGEVKMLAPFLMDLYAQRDSIYLLKEEGQLKLVDMFCGPRFKEAMEELKKIYPEYKSGLKSLEELSGDEVTREREKDLLRFEIDEIENANLKEGEDVELEEKYYKLQNFQKINTALSKVMEKISYGDDNVSDSLGEAVREMVSVTGYDKDLENILKMLNDADEIISDVIGEINDYTDREELDENAFYELESRVNLYNRLKSRYSASVREILENLEEKKEKLDILENAEEHMNRMKADIEKKKERIISLTGIISEERKKTAEELSEKISKAAKELNFNDVRFKIEISTERESGINGCDSVSFLISFNPGESLKPLALVSSGGELSRIMLAIKTVATAYNDTETLIFDEIDAGISGITAQCVAKKMASLAVDKQIICITHLPQIAAMADNHFVIYKDVKDGASATHLEKLNKDGSIDELARLLGGSKITESVLNNARELIDLAGEYKNAGR